METTRDQIIEMIQQLPSTVSTDDVLEKLLFRLSIERGLESLERGEGIPHEEVEKRILKWLE
jgi:predicted transcriptional regulator